MQSDCPMKTIRANNNLDRFELRVYISKPFRAFKTVNKSEFVVYEANAWRNVEIMNDFIPIAVQFDFNEKIRHSDKRNNYIANENLRAFHKTIK